MKKIISWVLLAILIASLLPFSSKGISAQSSVVLDTLTGNIIYEKQGEKTYAFCQHHKNYDCTFGFGALRP